MDIQWQPRTNDLLIRTCAAPRIRMPTKFELHSVPRLIRLLDCGWSSRWEKVSLSWWQSLSTWTMELSRVFASSIDGNRKLVIGSQHSIAKQKETRKQGDGIGKETGRTLHKATSSHWWPCHSIDSNVLPVGLCLSRNSGWGRSDCIT